jgi:hypothetical protein
MTRKKVSKNANAYAKLIINKLAQKKQLIHVALHLISRHEKPNLHIIYNHSHIATTSNISKITRELDH